MRSFATFLCSVLTTMVLFAGCVQNEDNPETPPPPAPFVKILDSSGNGIPFARVTALVAGEPIALLSADATGSLRRTEVPKADAYLVTATGHGSVNVPDLPVDVVLPTGTSSLVASLTYRPFVDLTCPSIDPPPYSCGRFGEPVVEVAGDGAIWASATCCVGRSPPIWISRDGGLTFKILEGEGSGVVRDGFGIEGDFAMDDAGHVYFFDISAATSYITSYTAAGEHRWTVPFPFPPLVDRPWIRAGVEDQVFIAYNTGQTTRFYESTDGGKTWDVPGGDEFPCPLGTIGQGPNRNDLFITACGSAPQIWTTRDGGKTWSGPEDIPLPEGKFNEAQRGTDFRNPPLADAAGNVYVPFQHKVDPKNDDIALFLARRDAAGEWAGPWMISPDTGLNFLPWPAAAEAGEFAVAWYHSDSSEDGATTEWKLFSAASIDADSDAPHFQLSQPDPEILHTGAFGRAFGDFLESDITPDGRFVIVYAKQIGGGGPTQDADDIQNRFVSTDGGLKLGAGVPRNGPKA